ncbi:MAG TPA: nitrate ABC transporter permease [Chryseosolibacter sp.]
MNRNRNEFNITGGSSSTAARASVFRRILNDLRPALTLLAHGSSTLAFSIAGFAILAVAWALVASVSEGFPGPGATLKTLGEMLRNPFHEHGPNDVGIGLQLGSSLLRVFSGFLLASLVAIPSGMLMGANRHCRQVFYPVVQVLKPISPLAWFPIGLVAFQSAGTATVFIIFITSVWPTLINTAFGVSSLPSDYRNVAKVFGFSRWKYLTRVVVPYSLPHIITGLRLSIGVAWLVIVAGEMLSGGTGIGFFVWDSWNALSLEKVISAILIIGVTGLLLDSAFAFLQKTFSYSA